MNNKFAIRSFASFADRLPKLPFVNIVPVSIKEPTNDLASLPHTSLRLVDTTNAEPVLFFLRMEDNTFSQYGLDRAVVSKLIGGWIKDFLERANNNTEHPKLALPAPMNSAPWGQPAGHWSPTSRQGAQQPVRFFNPPSGYLTQPQAQAELQATLGSPEQDEALEQKVNAVVSELTSGQHRYSNPRICTNHAIDADGKSALAFDGSLGYGVAFNAYPLTETPGNSCLEMGTHAYAKLVLGDVSYCVAFYSESLGARFREAVTDAALSAAFSKVWNSLQINLNGQLAKRAELEFYHAV